MKKSSHTMERNIGIYVLGLLVFLAISCSQDVLAAGNVTLKVNAAASAMANKIYYKATSGATTLSSYTLPWTEKAVYGGPTDGEVKITVKNEMSVAADLIVKVDILTATSITTGGALTITSGWLKYDDGLTQPFGVPAIVIANNNDTVDGVKIIKGELDTLVLTRIASKTTMTLFDFSTSIKMPVHIIVTALLVDTASPVLPATTQVLGVDVQSIFFNAVDASATGVPLIIDTPMWFDLIQASPTATIP